MKDRAEYAQQFLSALPHAVALGMKVESIGNGTAVVSMPYDKKLIGDLETGVLHGGAISSVMDTACGGAILSHESVEATATIDLRIDYMRTATPGQDIRVTATCYHVARSVAFLRAVAMDEDTENPVATATGAFTMEQRK